MADNPLGIGGGRGPSGADILKEVLGLGAPRGPVASAGAATTSAGRGGAFGARGKRMLPADYPLESLDHGAARGTYLDILV